MANNPYELLERALGRPLLAPLPDREATDEEWNDFYRKDQEAFEVLLAISNMSKKIKNGEEVNK